jgi:WD40 repeat protein/serine/threonine protein kinase
MATGHDTEFRDQVASWIREAQTGSPEAMTLLLDACRPHLLLVARRDLPERLQSDDVLNQIVDETLLEGRHRFEQFASQHEDEFFAWLKDILQSNITHARRLQAGFSTADSHDVSSPATAADPASGGDFVSLETKDPADDAREPPVPSRHEVVSETAEAREPIGAVDDFQLLREIGRGGMGIIYEAWQVTLRRRVALKILPAAAMLDPRRLARFQNEARLAATLDHPHIVKVYAVGGGESVPYFAMQYIDGRSLADEIDALREYGGDLPLSEAHTRSNPTERGESPAKPPSEKSKARLKAAELGELTASYGGRPFFHRVARLGIQVCEAIEHAHSRGIIHRDIKPANLLVDDRDWLWVADFGLARTLADSGLTAAGDMMGTLRYASPEQALGKASVNERSDLYSVGASLYELITLMPFFDVEEPEALLHAVVHEAPLPPSRIVPQIPRDLETILLSATAKDPEDRYASAGDMAYDLQAFLDNRPILARRSNVIDRLVKWSRRNSVSVNATLITAALVLVVAAIFLYIEQRKTRAALREARHHLRDTKQANAQAEQALREKNETAQLLSDRLYIQSVLQAADGFREGDPLRSHQSLKELKLESGKGTSPQASAAAAEEQRRFEWRFLSRICEPPRESVAVSDQPLYCVTFAPNGDMIAVAGQDAVVRLYDARTMALRSQWPTDQTEVNQISFSPDGQRVATAGDDGTVRIWEIESQTSPPPIRLHAKRVYQATFSHDGKSLFTAGEESKVRRLNVENGESMGEISIEAPNSLALAASLDGRWLAIAEDSARVSLYDLAANTMHAAIPLRGNATTVAFSPDGRFMATGDKSDEVLVFATGQTTPLQSFQHSDEIGGLSFSPNSQWLACSDRGGVVGFHPIGDKTAPEPAGVDSTDPTVKQIAYRRRLAANHLLKWRAHIGRAYEMAWSPDGGSLFSVGDDGALRRWRPFEECVVRPLSPPSEFVAGRDVDLAAAQEEGRFVVLTIGPDEKSYLRWIDAKQGISSRKLPLEKTFDRFAITADGARTAFKAAGGGHIEFSDAARPERRWRNSEGRAFMNLTFSPDGALLATTQDDNFVQLIETASGGKRSSLSASNGSAAPAFSPDDKWLAFDSHNDIVIWDIARNETRAVLEGHDSTIVQTQFSHDGQILASISKDRTLRLWSSDSWKEVRRVVGHAEELTSMAFSPDDATIATGDTAGRIILWSTKYGIELCTIAAWEAQIEDLVFSAGGRYLAWRAEDATWIADTGTEVKDSD